ncbi:PREDICTED: rab11 family-interacting protein 4 [Ceratosolen solmsi marchali]|uniref:Rab11 family-interacting protein 4 n=1 Tax=Ceratosolen solmsi marchali TaxID=326594 RepID=A0AAJ6YBI1_9HYME|nr:PREDICTED: rab11 family-interacting protein 4 [Ceratosolen solmsi marchali]XP_011493932.1 PREDICTED: rab11 family-interacting protein 4 [Ceratosolen solmsi marchali]
MVSSRTPGLRSESLQERSSFASINNGDPSSLDAALERQRPSSSTWSQSEPTSLSSSSVAGTQDCGPYSASPVRLSNNAGTNSTEPGNEHVDVIAPISNLAADDEERYEAFGIIDDTDSPQGSGSPTTSPIAGANLNRNPRSPNSMLLGRHTWLRASLGRSPASTNRKRLSSSALASQLYRSSSFNSSGRGSICDTADDVYSDVSLEDDVIDLNHRVQMIQEQMHVLVDTHSAGEEKYARVKQENATLHVRILMLEEAAKDVEARAEERLQIEQRRHRDWASRLEREKELQLENWAIKLQSAELENTRIRDETSRLREQLEKQRTEKARLESILEEVRLEVTDARESERHMSLNLNEVMRALKRAENELTQRLDAERRMEDMTQEMVNLRTRNKNLEESRDELQAAAVALQAGRELLMPSGQDPNDNTINRKNSPSLATELLLTRSTHDQADGIQTEKSSTTEICDNFTTLAEAKQALKEQREVNTRLRSYIDGILLNIVENYPQLLEVKQPQ